MKINLFNNKNNNIYFNDNNYSFHKIINESLLSVREKNAKNISDSNFAYIVSFDPKLHSIANNLTNEIMADSNESYIRWLIKMFNKGQLENQDKEKVQNILNMFDYAKSRRTLLPNNDINSYNSIKDIESALSNISDNLTVGQKNKDAKRNQKKLKGEKKPGMYMNGAVELLFMGDDWEVWTPHTFEGSKALRRGANWCTGGDSDNYYISYTNDGTLYVIMNKNDNNDKYQLFVPFDETYDRNREFRDKNDNELSFRNFVHSNKELLNFFLTRDDVNEAYPNLDDDNVDDEWTEEKDQEIIDDYNLMWTSDGPLGIDLYMPKVCKNCEYTNAQDYIDIFRDGYLDQPNSNYINLFYEECIKNEMFAELDWSNTYVETLYKMYKKETGNNDTFQEFLYALFDTDDNGWNDYADISDWLDKNRQNKSTSYPKQVREVISTYIFDMVIADDVFDNLHRLGFTNDDFGNGEDYIIYPLDDIYSTEDFYEAYIRANRFNTFNEMYDYFDLYVTENVSSDNVDYGAYESEYLNEDSEKIFDLFKTNDDYNNFDEDDEENDSSKDIDEVLKIAGVKL